METSDLLSALRVAMTACRAAEKEASFARTALSEDEWDMTRVKVAEDDITSAYSYLEAALGEVEKIKERQQS
jgi:hypothetical protein